MEVDELVSWCEDHHMSHLVEDGRFELDYGFKQVKIEERDGDIHYLFDTSKFDREGVADSVEVTTVAGFFDQMQEADDPHADYVVVVEADGSRLATMIS